MPGGDDASGGHDDVTSPAAPAERRQQQRHPKSNWLPLDVVAAIAARSDAATLVRCAATCRAARRLIAVTDDDDPSFHRRLRLRLRHTDRFVLPLLRGHLTCPVDNKDRMWILDTTAGDDTCRFVRIPFPPLEGTIEPLDSRGGLVLLRLTGGGEVRRELRVLDLATDRSQALPSEPTSDRWAPQNVHYVLLVGGDGDDGVGGGGATANAAVGRPFQVLKTNLVLTKYGSSLRRLQVQIFSSELGAWGPLTDIPTPSIHGRGSSRHAKPLVVGDVVHWLCLTGAGSYVLMLHVVGAARRRPRVTVTTLPESFPRAAAAVPRARGSSSSSRHHHIQQQYSYLLATASAGGSPVVLVADDKRISAWQQSKHTKMWKQKPQVVIDKEEFFKFDNVGERLHKSPQQLLQLECFGERSGAVLIRISKCGFFWLDLQSKKIVRHFSNPRTEYTEVHCSYEMCLSSWVPTFSSGTL